MNNKQLYEKLGQNSYDKVFPITYLQNILDKDTNNDLTVVLSRFNHLWIPYQGTRVNTRKAVPAIFRRNSLTISYYDAEHNEALKQMIAGDGKVNIINYPDEEDITIRLSPGCCNVNRLSLKDRPYEPEYKSGKGYKIIRKVLLPVASWRLPI